MTDRPEKSISRRVSGAPMMDCTGSGGGGQERTRSVSAAELAKLRSILGHELLVEMLEISPASLQRYQNGDREALDAIAEKAHFLTSVIAALEGTYNEFGVRRWFDRPRSIFNGRTARQLLSRRWTPSDESCRRVLAAAESLQELGAT